VAGNFPRIYSINALPTQDVGPIIVAECSEVWNWMAGQYFTGYRSPLCGRPLDGHTNLPLASEVDATGGLLSKTDYAALWGYAQEQGLVKTEAVWSASRGSHWFSDYSATQFRVPDLRDMFRRFTGTDADTANARAMGTRQNDELRTHSHSARQASSSATIGTQLYFARDAGEVTTSSLVLPFGGKETRPFNTAYRPRIHA
jgi:hypothetical protein